MKVQIVLNRMNLLHSEVNGGLPAAKLVLYTCRTFQELVFKEVEMGQVVKYFDVQVKEDGGLKYVSIMGRAFPCTAAERCEGRRWRGMVLVFSHIKMLSGAMCCPPCQPSVVPVVAALFRAKTETPREGLWHLWHH